MHAGGTQILMIEDDDQDVEIVRELLSFNKSSITLKHRRTLSTGITFLHETKSIDLVLLDLCLSDTQGLETFHKIHEMFPSLPLVILSGNTDETIAIEAMQDGAQDFLVKGRFNSTLLSRTIQYALERQKQQLELQYKNTTLLALSEQLEIANRELERLATMDGLTRVYNRRQFDSVFQREWHRLCREEQPLSVILGDVDHFKAYNDTYGHQAGDQCLQQVAQAIARIAQRPADCVARYGGEEFVVLLPNTDLSGALHVAEAIREEVEELNIPHRNSSASKHISLSLGVASLIPNEDIPASSLIQSADQALYTAKDLGRNQVTADTSDSTNPRQLANQTLLWTQRIEQALEKDYFQLYAQPIHPLSQDREKQCFEILLRLCDQPHTVISPGFFLPIAEQKGYMNRIDYWVIEHLFADLQEIKATMEQNTQFFINLSARSCNNGQLIEFLQQQLTRFNLYPEEFCFEISESVALKNISNAAKLSKELTALGCQVALDDFGNGLSSFMHLKSIPADYLKIDGSFVKDIGSDPVATEIVGAIHRLAKSMGMQTIAEYVESELILDTISSFGIDFAQGHYYAQAQPLIETLVTYQSIPFRQGAES
ncbi:bifunctional diguanylate cyclase/phosphodiesterase [Acaryochloris sp. CCMEE 5410]|uniref:putative bifunctional diguanylate cyclase/phosphodiesterase n=1 Tax=Acaryochloris sp. CCMEE 5410 TaxID=310037 RepID=UPI0002484777|nr:EAL domain-containing protein [Acaryochloris sp. CCMEE 5410]KAI9132847.1 EAL domain-containing protein [Acaryochloris sp. CCMEE 5410]